MKGNHHVPHSEESKRKMSEARRGVAAIWRRRPTIYIRGVINFRCGSCHGFFPRDSFPLERRTLLGIKSQCKKCHSACSVKSLDRDKKKQRSTINEANRRARMSGSTGVVSKSDWESVKVILGELCLKCGSREDITCDHIVPLSKGGIHHPTNLQPLCRTCNEIKQARTADYRPPDKIRLIESLWVISFRRIEQSPCK